MPPDLIIVAGPNGAGKSTLTAAKNFGVPVLDPDAIARSASGPDANRLLAAGRDMHVRIAGFLAAGTSFGLETALSGRTVLATMRQAKRQGYLITLHHIGLDTLDLSRARIAQRGGRGGHGVPERDVERRFPRSLANLPAAMTIADRTYIYDNSALAGHRLIAEAEGARLNVLDNNVRWLQRLAGRL
jgi:predicted ABC-type ATPase